MNYFQNYYITNSIKISYFNSFSVMQGMWYWIKLPKPSSTWCNVKCIIHVFAKHELHKMLCRKYFLSILILSLCATAEEGEISDLPNVKNREQFYGCENGICYAFYNRIKSVCWFLKFILQWFSCCIILMPLNYLKHSLKTFLWIFSELFEKAFLL